jgi:hypothetical protein
VARLRALFHAGTGPLPEVAAAPLRSHEMSGVAGLLPLLPAGDVLVADRGSCWFAHLAPLMAPGVHAVFRRHQEPVGAFTPGRPHAAPGRKRGAKGLPRSRWIRACGPSDRLVAYFKPAGRPDGMSAAEYGASPGAIGVRERRYRIDVPGSRTHEVAPVTTRIDAEADPADALAGL